MKSTYRFLSLFCLSFSLSILALAAKVEVKGRQLLVEGKAFQMKAVCYNPVVKGGRHPDGLTFRNPTVENLEAIDEDFRLMKEAGINTIRTYEAITDKKVLDLVAKHKLFMVVPAFNYYEASLRRVVEIVETLKNNPQVLLWEIGNEWNYNGFYSQPKIDEKASIQLIHAAAALIKALDKSRPVSTTYGEIPSQGLLSELSEIDLWGINIYSGITFGDRFERWKKLSTKPMYLGEFGADAYNSLTKKPDVESQGKATRALLGEIQNNLSAKNPQNATIGGALYEWNDEWWKDEKGSVDSQDIGGIAPGGGPFPDATFNEEWWGVVDIDRNIRPAYSEIKEIWGRD